MAQALYQIRAPSRLSRKFFKFEFHVENALTYFRLYHPIKDYTIIEIVVKLTKMVSARRVNRNRGSVLYVKKGEQSLNVLTRTVVDFIIKSVSNWINFQRARNAHYINAGPVQAGP